MRGIFPVALALAFAPSVLAQPAAAQSTGATVTKDLGCGGFVPTQSGGVGALIYTTEGAVVVKGNGSTSLTCHFDIPSGLEPKTTTRSSGFLCITYLGSTTDSRMQASSGGNATLTCRIRTRTR
ncbi:MAG: hypothetical protein V4696_04410 [Pseudomonadota bacterium]